MWTAVLLVVYTAWPLSFNCKNEEVLVHKNVAQSRTGQEMADGNNPEDYRRPNFGRRMDTWQRHSWASHGTHRNLQDSIEFLRSKSTQRVEMTKEQRAGIKVLLVTNSINDVNVKAGIATVVLRQAETHARRGYGVSILCVMQSAKEKKSLVEKQKAQLKRIGIDLHPLYQDSYPAKSYGSKSMTRSYQVYHWMLFHKSHFSAVIFHDFGALGFYPLWARMTGFEFNTTPMTVMCVSSNRMNNQYEARAPGSRDVLVEYYMERKVIEMADYIIAPSTTYFTWMREMGYEFSHEKTLTLQTILKHGNASEQKNVGLIARPLSVAYIGAINRHGGAFLLAEAVKHMNKTRMQLPRTLTFIGTDPTGTATKKINNTLHAVGVRLEIKSMSTSLALTRLQEESFLLVRPSYEEHISVPTLDAVAAGIPTIMTAGIGTSEILPPECLSFQPNTVSLADTLNKILTKGMTLPAMRRSPSEAASDIVDYFESVVLPLRFEQIAHPVPQIALPKDVITIGVPTNHRPEELQELLESFLAQDYKHFKVMLVDDVKDEEMERVYKWAIIRFAQSSIGFEVLRPNESKSEIMYAAEKRNLLITSTQTEYILLMDDDDIAYPNMVSLMLKEAVRSNADLVSGFCNNFKTYRDYGLKKDLYVALAAGYAQGGSFFVHNTGKATVLMKKEAAERAGGCTVDSVGEKSPYVDWDLYTNIGLAGFRISFVPTSVYRYRERSKNSIYYSIDAEGRWLGHRKMVHAWCRKHQLNLEECDVLEFSRGKLAKPFVLSFGEYE
eukprot:CFRG7961T1